MIRRAKPFLLGTLIDITVFDTNRDVVEAIDSAFNRIEEIHNCMSFHSEQSDLSLLNRTSPNTVIEISPDLIKVLSICLELNFVSKGAFNPTIASVMKQQQLLPNLGPNYPVCFTALSDAIEIQSQTEILVKQGVCLDLGGIAKGYAVDQACSVLEGFGITNAIVNAGGDLRAIGNNAHDIIIRNPQYPESSVCLIHIENQALATSSSYYSISENGMSVHFDGRTGNRCKSSESISIRTKECVYADALTKLPFILKDSELEIILENYDAELFVASAEASEWSI